MDEIINKVAQSGLVEINLENYLPQTEIISLDIKPFLSSMPIDNSGNVAYILREKIFRNFVLQIDEKEFQDKYVAVFCSVEAIIPAWAYMLISIKLTPCAKQVFVGDKSMLEEILLIEELNKIELNQFANAKVVIKGCSHKKIGVNAYQHIASLLKPVVKSIMYGEPCSTVPLYKQAAIK
ncbi:MAG: DUF2480 family protein [Bacteroidia bacterium]|nr:DUF2480 family protein [Bacteroidia bacterium]MCZ2248255.1 DUF2480 family protein [Bacteroidia bacterium]